MKIWSEHLKISNGEHDCKIQTNDKNIVTIEFKKNKKKIGLRPGDSFYENSIYHREERSKKNDRERAKNIKRLMGTIKQGELYEDLSRQLESLSLQEQCKAELENRQEARQFLQKTLSFLSELHFVCEHTYLLLSDNSIVKNYRTLLLNILNSIELIIWKIHYIFETNSGVKAINELKDLMKKGLNCLSKLNNLTDKI